MSGKTVVVVICEDKRLHQRPDGKNYLASFIAERKCWCYPVTSGGDVLDLVRPAKEDYREAMLKNIGIGVANGADEVYLIGHEDCLAYPKFKTREEELEQRLADLNAAEEVVRQVYPHVGVRKFFAELSGIDEFCIRPAEDLVKASVTA